MYAIERDFTVLPASVSRRGIVARVVDELEAVLSLDIFDHAMALYTSSQYDGAISACTVDFTE